MKSLPESLDSLLAREWTREESFDYCGDLARRHYENFHLGSFLFPRKLRPHLHAIYAYCRWADDLADEVGDDATRGRGLLDRFAAWVEETYQGNPPRHPVFVALADSVRRFRLPKRAFLDLLVAFRWDLEKKRWATFEELLEYCRYSANPVGRLFLGLYGVEENEARPLADATCTALQLANHWQDVSRDLARDRIYLPQSDLAAHHLTEEDLRAFAGGGPLDERWRGLMREEVSRARDYFRRGASLVELLPGRLRLDVRLFTLGGWAILDRIEAADYDVFRERPTLSTQAKTGLVVRALFSNKRSLPA